MAFNTGETVVVRVVFHNWEEDEDGFGDPVDPDSVEVKVYSGENLDVLELTDIAEREAVGVYSYNFVSNENGIYKVEIIGTFQDGSISTATSTLAVGVDVEEVPLGVNYEIEFLTDLEPLLIDPEELKMLYPEAELSDITSLVHKYSIEVEKLFKNVDPPFVAYEYIHASVACALSQMHGLFGDADDFTLGDLSYSRKGSVGRGAFNRGNASNPCELAAALRNEVIRGSQSMKGVVRGVRRVNKIPQRNISHAERRIE